MRTKSCTRAAATLLVVLMLTGCATSHDLKLANAEAKAGNWDAAITYYQRALRTDPDNVDARIRVANAKLKSAQVHREAGARQREAGNLERAVLELELAVRLDPVNDLIAAEYTEIREELAAAQREALATKTPLEEAVDRADAAASPLPRLEVQLDGPIGLDFRRANIKEIYRALGRLGGVNVLFDSGLRNDSTSFHIEDVEFDEALEILTAAHGHFHKVIGPKTVLILQDNQQNRRQHADQVMRTFYLSNASAETVASSLQTLLQARLVAQDPNLNAVTIRDTPEVVEVAESIVNSLDKARGEVLLDIEVLEVNRSVLEEWGLSLSSYSVVGSLAQGDTGISAAALGEVTNADIFLSIPSIKYQFFKENNDFKLVAQPQVRASEGQQTSLLIGQRVPIISTTFNPQNTSGGDVIPIATTNYEDVGILISVQPRVHHNGEVTLQLEFEISAVTGESPIQNLPIFSTRTLSTVIRLRDGETNLMAGLLREDERTRLTGFPVLMDIPILGKLFSSNEQEVVQNDVMLSITPHILRTARIEESDLATVFVGSEAVTRAGGGGGGRRGGGGGGGDDEGLDADVPQDPVLISLRPSIISASVGDRISVDLDVDGNVDVFSVGVRLDFDPAILRFVRATEGNLLDSDGGRTTFQAAAAGAGSVAIGASRIGEIGNVFAGGSLGSMEFEVVGPGSGDLRVSSAAVRDDSGRPYSTLEFENATIDASGQ